MRYHALPRLGNAQTGQLSRRGGHLAVAPDYHLEREVMRIPPLHVGRVAEGAAHHRACTLLRVGLRVRQQRHVEAEQRHADALANELRVTGIGGMHEDGDAGRQQFRASRGDGQDIAVFQAERQRDELALALKIVQLGLRDGGAALGAPDRRRFLAIGQPLFVEVDEGELRRAPRKVVDGAIGIIPVDRQPQSLPQGLIVPLGLFAHLQA